MRVAARGWRRRGAGGWWRCVGGEATSDMVAARTGMAMAVVMAEAVMVVWMEVMAMTRLLGKRQA